MLVGGGNLGFSGGFRFVGGAIYTFSGGTHLVGGATFTFSGGTRLVGGATYAFSGGTHFVCAAFQYKVDRSYFLIRSGPVLGKFNFCKSRFATYWLSIFKNSRHALFDIVSPTSM